MGVESASTTDSRTYTEIFNDILPSFMAIGMTPKEFWWGDNDLPKAYLKAQEIKDKRQNTWLWWQGMYFYEALCDVAPALQAFNKKPKPSDYAKEPYPLTEKDITEKKKREEQLKYEKMKAFMKARSDNGRS